MEKHPYDSVLYAKNVYKPCNPASSMINYYQSTQNHGERLFISIFILIEMNVSINMKGKILMSRARRHIMDECLPVEGVADEAVRLHRILRQGAAEFDSGGGPGRKGRLLPEPSEADRHHPGVYPKGAAGVCGAQRDHIGTGFPDPERPVDQADLHPHPDEAGMRGGKDR